jgi:predicted nucleic acid-binding protein
MISYVLDSFALVAYVVQESTWESVRDLLAAAQAGEVRLAMCTVNLGEVQYRLERLRGAKVARQTVLLAEALPIEIVAADWPLTGLAAELKAITAVSYAGCFAAAVAISRDAELVTGDPEFRLFGDRIKVRWLALPS